MTGIIALVVAALVGGTVLRGGLKAAWAFIMGVARVPFVLENVAKEFSPHSGDSMRDTLDRIENRVTSIELDGAAGYREVSDRVQLTEVRITKNEERLTALEDSRRDRRFADVPHHDD